MKLTYSWIARFYVSGSILVTAMIAMFDPISQHRAVLMDNGDLVGTVAMILLGALALAGILDVIINDWLPSRFSLHCTHRHRHVVYMVLAIGQVGLVYVLVHDDDLKPVIARYALDAIMAVTIAGKGIKDHYKQSRGVPT